MRTGLLAAAWLALALLSSGCGGGAGTPPARSGPGGGEATATKGAPKGDGDATAAAPAGPARPSCADGSCFPCGEGICPVGFYCETPRAGASPACAWVPSCAEKPTCACLGPKLGGCKCEERGGVPHVVCG